MPTVITHAIAATALGVMLQPAKGMPLRYWIAGAVCATLPDVDVLAFSLGIPYAHLLGHRGFSHSLFFAVTLATITIVLLRSRTQRLPTTRLWFFLFFVTASHGLLDAMTNGGLGVAFFSPLSADRYFFAWRPLQVSPISLSRFFSQRGLAVLESEVFWVWLPSLAIVVIAWFVRRPVRV
jgi:inner membrane protein